INAAGTTIILTTHYLEEAEQLCRNIAIIDQGRIVANSSMRELLNRMNSHTLLLDLVRPLQVVPELRGFIVGRIDDLTLEVEVPRDTYINGLFVALSAQGIEVRSLRNKSNRLEELFIRLVNNKETVA
ncbi:MAG: ABC transporter ATP-binding protein, partial [Halothiobacillaceae bacterium]